MEDRRSLIRIVWLESATEPNPIQLNIAYESREEKSIKPLFALYLCDATLEILSAENFSICIKMNPNWRATTLNKHHF